VFASVLKLAQGRLIAYAAAACLACLITGAGAGLWTGIRWQKGKAAILEIVRARAELVTLREDQRSQIQDIRTATDRLSAISGDYENERTRLRRTIDANATRLAVFVAAHPELGDCDVGPDGLRLWNDALRPAAAAASAAGQPDAAVPGFAAGEQQPVASAVGEPAADRRGGAGVPASARRSGEGGTRARGAGSGTLPALDRQDAATEKETLGSDRG